MTCGRTWPAPATPCWRGCTATVGPDESRDLGVVVGANPAQSRVWATTTPRSGGGDWGRGGMCASCGWLHQPEGVRGKGLVVRSGTGSVERDKEVRRVRNLLRSPEWPAFE